MIVAGIGCRRGCPAEDILRLVREAGPVDALAAPAWKRQEPGLLAAAQSLGLVIHFIEAPALSAVQDRCPTRSAVAMQTVGFASVAEAAALAGGGTLLRARYGRGSATCAVAVIRPHPGPLPQAREGEKNESTAFPLPFTGEGQGEG